MEVEKALNRTTLLNKLTTETVWDMVVIGGGATGLGVALEAISRGYKVALFEQADFAKGTSSRSTKLVHGGVRYLAQGDVHLVREASIERGLLWRNAPHLVKNQTFVIPVYTWWDKLKYTLGLKLYDWIAGSLSLGPSVFVSRKEAIQKLPNVKTEGLVGGVLYHDGQFDDSRLAINLAQTIIERGGVALNYMKVTALQKNTAQHIDGVQVQDIETGATFLCKAKAVVNATGVFVDAILHMDNPTAPKSITASQGAHLVLDKKFYPASDALMIPSTSDGRVLFAVPWHGKVVVGTTDTPVNEASLEPKALESEITFILDNAASYLVQQPKRSDVLSVYAGLRPLAAPQHGARKTKEISRSHKIIVAASRLFTIIGGKWTTFRKMGEDMVTRIEKELQWPPTKTATKHLAIHGHRETVNQSDPLYFYGTDAEGVKTLMNGHASEWLSASLQIHEAQVIWAVRHEMARTVEDVLARRTRALLLDARESIRIAGAVASIMAKELYKDDQWIQEQVTAYTQLAQGYILDGVA